MRIQSCHPDADRGLDAYFSPPEAVHALLAIEGGRIPKHIWEPAAGNGAIVKPLLNDGHAVTATDIADYGLHGCTAGVDYLRAKPGLYVRGIITNPPYKLAEAFARKAVSEVSYVAFLLRTNWLESTARLPFFREHPPARLWISSRRLPMMHRHGWTGPKAPSNTCFAWFVWDAQAEPKTVVNWFDWKDYA